MNIQYRKNYLMTIPAIILIVIAAYFSYAKIENDTRAEIGRTLQTVLNGSHQSLRNWLHDQKALARTWADNEQLRRYAVELTRGSNYNQDLIRAPAQAALRKLLLPVLKQTGNRGYFLIDPDFINLASSRDYNLGFSNLLIVQEDFLDRTWAGQTLVSIPQSSDVPIRDFAGELVDRYSTMFVATPVKDDSGRVIAILAFRLDPDEGYSRILAAGRFGQSGETYAFDRTGRLLSESLFNRQLERIGLLPNTKHSSLLIHIRDPGVDLTAGGKPDRPWQQQPLTRMARSAAAGENGLDLDGYRDYRGVRVIGAWDWDKEYGFGIATEIDFVEAYRSLWNTRLVIAMFAVFSCMLLIGLAAISGKGQRKVAESGERLSLAIENISDGFALYDADDRLILFNRKFRRLYPGAYDLVVPGVRFEDLVRAGAKRGEFPAARGRIEQWLAERMELRREPAAVFEEQAIGGRWIRVAEKAVPGGGRVGIFADITDLVAAREEADLANRAKSQFLSSMSHELRTPLNAVLGFAQMLEFNPKEPLTADQKHCVDHIMNGGQHLLELINEVLDLAKIESGTVTLSVEDVATHELLEECLTLVDGIARKGGITVHMTGDDRDWPPIHADYTRTKQIILNLLSNAIKYNRTDGSVFVESEPGENGMLRIIVRDTGPGIPEKLRDGLFEPFNRLGAESSEIEGTGIGLTITKELVEIMDGRVGVESVIGEGSTFWIDLPLSENTDAVSGIVKQAASGTTDMAVDLSGRVLYVEDNPSNLKLMEMIFGRASGLKLTTAKSAEIGLELARAAKPDAILMDINLPGMDGYAALEELKKDPETSHIPVIAVTANATGRDLKKGKEAGFLEYLTKPVNVTELMAALHRALTG